MPPGPRSNPLASCVVSPRIVSRVLDLAQVATLPETVLRLDWWPENCTRWRGIKKAILIMPNIAVQRVNGSYLWRRARSLHRSCRAELLYL